jgi:plastocyanin
MKNTITAVLVALLAAVIIAGCGDDNKTTNPPPDGGGFPISIVSETQGFSPDPATISVGDAVVWTNDDGVPHTSTSNTGVWNSGSIAAGQTFRRVFSAAGTFPYHCSLHPTMTGTIIVEEPAARGHIVTITDFSFSPASLTISAGDTVTWRNNGPSAHTSTSNTGVWNSGLLGQGQTYTRVFNATGSFPYHCIPHPQMTGTITVQ